MRKAGLRERLSNAYDGASQRKNKQDWLLDNLNWLLPVSINEKIDEENIKNLFYLAFPKDNQELPLEDKIQKLSELKTKLKRRNESIFLPIVTTADLLSSLAFALMNIEHRQEKN